ncbi:hypothetical protein HOC01_03630 [archaeon]|jgi:hypothetical protein|nr:hypothetical protein [archaeon]MBT6698498.1 hypothetical protein [archaeon]
MIDSFEAMVHLIYGVTDTDDTGDEKNKVISEAKSMRFYFNNLNGDFESHNLLLDDFDLEFAVVEARDIEGNVVYLPLGFDVREPVKASKKYLELFESDIRYRGLSEDDENWLGGLEVIGGYLDDLNPNQRYGVKLFCTKGDRDFSSQDPELIQSVLRLYEGNVLDYGPIRDGKISYIEDSDLFDVFFSNSGLGDLLCLSIIFGSAKVELEGLGNYVPSGDELSLVIEELERRETQYSGLNEGVSLTQQISRMYIGSSSPEYDVLLSAGEVDLEEHGRGLLEFFNQKERGYLSGSDLPEGSLPLGEMISMLYGLHFLAYAGAKPQPEGFRGFIDTVVEQLNEREALYLAASD